MHTALPLFLAVLVSVAIMVIGFFYLASPERIMGGFGLMPPTLDAVTRPWLRTRGVRDVASGVAVFALMLTTSHRTVGILLLALALIPFGDMCNVLGSRGSRATAFSVHGLTCVAMLFAGLLLIDSV